MFKLVICYQTEDMHWTDIRSIAFVILQVVIVEVLDPYAGP
jgi:hypothetical protein